MEDLDAERNEIDVEINDHSAASRNNNQHTIQVRACDDVDDSEISLADSNELASSTRTVESENLQTEISVDEGTTSNNMNNLQENLAEVCRHFSPAGFASDNGTINPDELTKQLRSVTKFAQTQRKELYQAKYALNALMQEHVSLKSKNAKCCCEGNESNLAKKSLAELNQMEDQVRGSLDRILKAKEVACNNMEEARVCVICKVNPKSVLFLNCRHLCVCHECGHLDVLVQCPLCRKEIREKINVYA